MTRKLSLRATERSEAISILNLLMRLLRCFAPSSRGGLARNDSFYLILFFFCLPIIAFASSTYTDPYERFTLEFPAGWVQEKTFAPEQLAYFTYQENGVTLAEAIIYSHRLPHAMEPLEFEAQIFESFRQQKDATVVPDPASIAVRSFGAAEGVTDEADYWTPNQTALRVKNFYFLHAYTGTGIVIRFWTFKQRWQEISPRFEEVIAKMNVSVANITLEGLPQKNLLTVTEPPIFQHPESFQPAYPWKTSTPSTPYDESILANVRLLKAAANNDPALRASLPQIEKYEKEYETRILQKQFQPQPAAQTLANATGQNATQPEKLPEGSALKTFLGGPSSDNLTGDIYGELQTPIAKTPQDTTLPTLDFTTWQDPLNRFSMIYPKGYTPTQKGQWYLSFDGPVGIQFLVLALMDHQAASDYLKSQIRNEKPIEERAVEVQTPSGKDQALLSIFRTRNENLEPPNDMITIGILPHTGNILFLVSFPEERYQANEAVIKKIIEYFIQNIQLKGTT